MPTAPYLVVATGSSNTGRVYKLTQRGSRLTIDESTALRGHPSPALATNALVGPGAPAGGRVVVTTESNLYVLRADNLDTVARLSSTDLRRGCAPCDPDETAPASTATGLYTTTPLIAGGTIYVERDDGTQLVLDLDTAQPVPRDQFTQDPANAGPCWPTGQRATGGAHTPRRGTYGGAGAHPAVNAM